ncbi:MAG: alpha/beta hydrolase [Mycobacterium sp.]
MTDVRVPVDTRLVAALLPVLADRLKVLLSGKRPVVVDGNTLDPTVQLLLLLLRVKGLTGMMVGTDVVRSRQNMLETCVGLGGPRLSVQVDELCAPGPAGPLVIRRYRTERSPGTRGPALMYFHGGGFVLGDLDSYDALCRRICRDADVDVFSVDYRRAPEDRVPAAIEDCCAAYDWLHNQADELDIAAHRIAVGGDSAGGALAAVVSQWARAQGRPQPGLQFLVYPITELDAQTRSRTLFGEGFVLTNRDLEIFHSLYVDRSGVAPTDPRVSPLLADDLSGLPPALVVTAGFDPLRDEGEQYAAALTAAGVAVELRTMGSMIHGFINFAGLGGGVERSIAEVMSALRAQLWRA